MEGIYFRPAASQPYHVKKAAEWLTRLGKFKDVNAGYDYLIQAESKDLATFRYLMSEYQRVHSFKTGYLVYTSDVNAFRSATGPYGEELHMYY